jgi:peptidoglycan/LPS O-acetylase OafA/YrhL
VHYRSDIDGLRALAIIPVVLFHAGFSTFGGGYVGVDVFFVISGFLITSIITTDIESNQFSFAKFYHRRARRLLPALFFMLLVCIPLSWMWLAPKDMLDFSQSLSSVVIFLSNFYFISESDYFASEVELKPLLHTWSLAVEEQFYIFYPILLLSLRRVQKIWVPLLSLLALASFIFAIWATATYPKASFYLLPTRGFELLAGAITALLLIQQPRVSETSSHYLKHLSLLGLILIGYSVLYFNADTPFPGYYSLLPVVGCVLVIAFTYPGTISYKILSNKLLVTCGLASYSIYLLHQPIFAFARHLSQSAPSHELMILLCLLTFGLSYIIWRFIEQPLRRPNFISNKKMLVLALTTAAVIFAFGIGGLYTTGYPQRFGPQTLDIYERALEKTFDWGGCNLSCEVKDQKSHITLIGDSHATAIANELDDSLASSGYSFSWRTNPGCPPLIGFYDSKNQSDNCSKLNTNILTSLTSNSKVQWVVMSAQWSLYSTGKGFDNSKGGVEQGAKNYYFDTSKNNHRKSKARDEAVISGYIKYINTLLNNGINVIFVDQIPVAGWDIPGRYIQLAKRGKLSNKAFQYPKSVYDEHTKNLTNIRSISHPNFYLVSPAKILCADGVSCHSASLPDLYFVDTNHLSHAGAQKIVPQITATILYHQQEKPGNGG